MVAHLQRDLAEQKQASKEAQASALASQRQADHGTQSLRKALQAREVTVASTKVLWHVPGIGFVVSIPQRSRLLVCMSQVWVVSKGTINVKTFLLMTCQDPVSSVVQIMSTHFCSKLSGYNTDLLGSYTAALYSRDGRRRCHEPRGFPSVASTPPAKRARQEWFCRRSCRGPTRRRQH